jgi:hypothetical protein
MNKLILSVIISLTIAPVAIGVTTENSTSVSQKSDNSYLIAGFLDDLKETVDTIDKAVDTTNGDTQQTTQSEPPPNPFEDATTNDNSLQPTNNFDRSTNPSPVEGSTQTQPNEPATTPNNSNSNHFPW